MIGKEFGKRLLIAGCASMGLYACFGGGDGAAGEVAAFDGIQDGEVITAVGTEPFWTAQIDGAALTYSTPENADGEQIDVTRFAGNGGLGISGNLRGEALNIAITPGDCSDGMSDRRFPYIVTLGVGDAQLSGCAYTDRQPYADEGAELP